MNHDPNCKKNNNCPAPYNQFHNCPKDHICTCSNTDSEHCQNCIIPLGMSYPPSYTCWKSCPCHLKAKEECKESCNCPLHSTNCTPKEEVSKCCGAVAVGRGGIFSMCSVVCVLCGEPFEPCLKPKKECGECKMIPNGIISVDDVNNPHCQKCGRKILFTPSLKSSRNIGTHGENCPHCLNSKCECLCKVCRPDLWKQDNDTPPSTEVDWKNELSLLILQLSKKKDGWNSAVRMNDFMEEFVEKQIASARAEGAKEERERIIEEFRRSEMIPNNSGYIGVKEAKQWVYDILKAINNK